MDLIEAAHLIQKAYDRKLGNQVSHPPLNSNGVEAYLLKDGTLVIPGTNDGKDWQRNLDIGSRMAGASKRVWHKGFLEHARIVFHYAAVMHPKRVIGHSLGAAAAQIIGVSLKIPAICYASPRPLRGSAHFPGERDIININRHDDIVTQWPFFFRFRHVGKVHWISPREKQSEGSHSIPDYLRAMEQGRVRPELPQHWA